MFEKHSGSLSLPGDEKLHIISKTESQNVGYNQKLASSMLNVALKIDSAQSLLQNPFGGFQPSSQHLPKSNCSQIQSLDCQLTFLLLFRPQFSLSCNSLFFCYFSQNLSPLSLSSPSDQGRQSLVDITRPGMPWELHGRTVLSMNSMLDSDMQRKKGVNNLTD